MFTTYPRATRQAMGLAGDLARLGSEVVAEGLKPGSGFDHPNP